MSLCITVRFSKPIPSPAEWQQAISQASFPVSLHIDFDPKTMSGFLPTTYLGKPAGFEYFYEESDGGEAEVSFITHSSTREAMVASVSAACLCLLTLGVLEDYDGKTVAAGECLAWARAEVGALEPFEAKEPDDPAAESVPASKPWWKVW
jgi:hypothetical protein